MAAAGRVAVGVGMETILDDDDEELSSAEAREKMAAAMVAESNLMGNMLCGCSGCWRAAAGEVRRGGSGEWQLALLGGGWVVWCGGVEGRQCGRSQVSGRVKGGLDQRGPR